MSESGPGVTRHRLLITLNRVVAVLSILAAVLLYTGEPHLGIPGLAAARYHEPLIVHCLLTALLLFWGNAWLKDGWQRGPIVALLYILGACLLPLFALVDLAVAVFGLASPIGGVSAAVPLEVSGILCGLTFLAVLGSIANDDQGAEDQNRAEPTTAASRPSPGSILYSHLVEAVLYFVVYSGLIAAYLGFIPYGRLIWAAAIGGWFDGWTDFFATLGAESRDFPFLVILVVPAFGFLGWKGISAYLRQGRDQRK